MSFTVNPPNMSDWRPPKPGGSNPRKILYVDVLAMMEKLKNIDPAKTSCRHCGAPSLAGPHSMDCPWVKLDQFCSLAEKVHTEC